MKYLLILLLVISCGKSTVEVEDSQQRVDGDINVNINWNLDQFEDAFIDRCESEFDTQEEIDQCVTDRITNLTKLINAGIENGNKGE